MDKERLAGGNRMKEEGDFCDEEGCTGKLEVRPGENCSCHLSPPCQSCVEAPLVCGVCGKEFYPDEEEIE
jgi:hypothetical protein